MAISHADHDHPNTPAARAACRKSLMPKELRGQSNILPVLGAKPAQMTVVPRTKGDGGVVKGLQATAPKAEVRRLKVSGSKLTDIRHLADVPRDLAVYVREAWDRKLDVVAGAPFNDDERRIVVHAPLAEVAFVWDSNGRTAAFARNWNSSVTFQVTGREALAIASDSERWTEMGNLVKIGKPVVK